MKVSGPAIIPIDQATQTLSLPEAFAFPDDVKELVLIREGNRRILVERKHVWDDFFNEPGVDLGERENPPFQERESF